MQPEFLLNTKGAGDYNKFHTNISEIMLNLENHFGTPERLKKSAQQMFTLADQNAKGNQHEDFFMILCAIAAVSERMSADLQTFYDLKYELRSYRDGRFLESEDEEIYYFDHPFHQDYFKTKNLQYEAV